MTFLKKNDLILAPMAGVADTVFRRLCKRHGADITVSEMVSADGLHYKSPNTAALMSFDESERPIGVQLFGSDPDRLAEAARFTYESARPDFIDLNSGCPVAKVVKRNGGAALLKDPVLFGRIVNAMARAVPIPVTVKIRSGWEKYVWIDEEFARIAEGSGAAAVTLHPRSQTMMFTGHSFWERIAAVKKAVSIPVIGNGDVVDAESALKMASETGCDAIMVGRASFGNPWVFAEVRAALRGERYAPPSTEERRDTVLEHIRTFRDVHGERFACGEMKKCASWYIRGYPGAGAARSRIFASSSSTEIEGVVEEYFGLTLSSAAQSSP
ncbi:MAG: tRNA dihydrouridine synthase DusB [Chitinispirillia bacterium]|nr:tRNA dihydrouridine synthase DusB [Chitinispirillia bacterium]MCL2268523.1 tRNA dihydrouridine synthase DusB [Chitinispirillia bacterium]